MKAVSTSKLASIVLLVTIITGLAVTSVVAKGGGRGFGRVFGGRGGAAIIGGSRGTGGKSKTSGSASVTRAPASTFGFIYRLLIMGFFLMAA